MNNSTKSFWQDLAFVIIVMAAIVAFSMLTGCNAAKVVDKYNRKHPEKLAALCAEKFPVKESIIIRDSLHLDTVFISPEVIIDTVYLEGKAVVIHRQCPPKQVVTRTEWKERVITQRDSAGFAVLQNKALQAEAALKEKTTEADKEHKSRVKYMQYFFGLLALVALYIVLKLRFKIPF